MILVDSSFEIQDEIDGFKILKNLEKYGRTCYKSEDRITNESSHKFVADIIRRGHESVLEHEKITVRVICDRGVSHEIVRHRIASYSQESTRYCNYGKTEVKFIHPSDFELDASDKLLLAMIEQHYNHCLESGRTPQQARYFLPNGLKTEIVMTMNLREWRHFFKLRTANAAHPDMRALARPMLDSFKLHIPIVFDDITY
jgi:thymidylate synthase (FAD)